MNKWFLYYRHYFVIAMLSVIVYEYCSSYYQYLCHMFISEVGDGFIINYHRISFITSLYDGAHRWVVTLTLSLDDGSHLWVPGGVTPCYTYTYSIWDFKNSCLRVEFIALLLWLLTKCMNIATFQPAVFSYPNHLSITHRQFNLFPTCS